MNMIKKIAITASTMLFVVAQIFSFYIIMNSQREKLELLENREGKIMEESLRQLNSEVGKLEYKEELQNKVITYFFRREMPKDFALYQKKTELFNNMPYEFEKGLEKDNADTKDLAAYQCISKKIKDKHLLVFYKNFEIKKQNYFAVHTLDVTYIYESSRNLAVKEIFISMGIAGIMAVILIALIRKITKPLQAQNEAQHQLIGSMAHELKTPLTAIKGYSETLLNVTLSKEQEQKALNYIHTESGRLSRLSEKMMELTKLYEVEDTIELHSVSMEKLFEEVRKSVSHSLKEKNIMLLFEGEYQKYKKELDSDLMTSFLINLINNSIMASKPESHIYLGADKNAIWVRDEGCGIPLEEVDKVTKAFYRVDKSRSRKSGNMGLGLALCEQIAKAHHGTIKIESELGKGTKIIYQSFTTR